MTDPLEIPAKDSEYLARRGRKSKNGVPFQYKGDEVAHLQEILKKLDYNLSEHPICYFGAETDSAVREFQGSHRDLTRIGKEIPLLQKDGIVGPRTAIALNCELARRDKLDNDYEVSWTDEKEIIHDIICTVRTKGFVKISKKEDVNSIHFGWKPLSFLAIDGTASADADGFAEAMNKLKSTKGKTGRRVPVKILNLAQMLVEGEGIKHPLSKYVRKGSDGSPPLAINFHKEKTNPMDLFTKEYSSALSLFNNAGIYFAKSQLTFRPDIIYFGMHANLRGLMLFLPTPERNTLQIFEPRDEKKINWKSVKWVIFASCGSLSLHYRYFGIPGHGGAGADPQAPTAWTHRHVIDPIMPWKRKYLLTHYYPGLLWLRIIKKHAPKLHGVLGYWDKAPTGEEGFSPDKTIAENFVKRLENGETILEAWKQCKGKKRPQKYDWAAIVDDRYINETLEDLFMRNCGEPDRRRWMYASRYTGIGKGKKGIPIPIKEAFLEANMMDSYTKNALKGVFRLHKHYGKPLRGKGRKKYYPQDIMEKRKIEESKFSKEVNPEILEKEKEKLSHVKYPKGDIIEAFAFGGKGYRYFSSLTNPIAKDWLTKVIGATEDELKKTYRPVKVLLSGFKPWHRFKYNSSQFIAENMDGKIMQIKTMKGQTLVYVSCIVLPFWWYDAADWLIEEIKLGYPDIVIGFGMRPGDDPRVKIETFAQNKNIKNLLDAHDPQYTPEVALKKRPLSINKLQKTTNPEKVKADGPPKLPLDPNSRINIPHKKIKDALNGANKTLEAFVDSLDPDASSRLLRADVEKEGYYMHNQIFYNLMYHNLRPPPDGTRFSIVTSSREEFEREKVKALGIGYRSFKHDVMAGFIHVPALNEKQKLRKTAEKIVEVCVKEYIKREMYIDEKPFPLSGGKFHLYKVGDLMDQLNEWNLDVYG